MPELADAGALADENRRVRELRLLADLTAVVIRSRPLSRAEAETAVSLLRQRALALFPDKGGTFDLIYGARLRRIIDQRFDPT